MSTTQGFLGLQANSAGRTSRNCAARWLRRLVFLMYSPARAPASALPLQYSCLNRLASEQNDRHNCVSPEDAANLFKTYAACLLRFLQVSSSKRCSFKFSHFCSIHTTSRGNAANVLTGSWIINDQPPWRMLIVACTFCRQGKSSQRASSNLQRCLSNNDPSLRLKFALQSLDHLHAHPRK